MKYDDCNEGIMQFILIRIEFYGESLQQQKMIQSGRKLKEKWTVMMINKVNEAVKI